MEDVETKERKPLWGDRLNGCIIVTKDGQWTAIQTAEGRKAPKTDEDRAAAFRELTATNCTSSRRHSPSPILADDARYLGLDETVKRVLRPSFTARPRRLNYRHDSAGMRLVSAAKGWRSIARRSTDCVVWQAGQRRSVAQRPADVLLVVLRRAVHWIKFKSEAWVGT